MTPSVADSTNRRFRLPGDPVLFSCEAEALVKKKEFRDHVEDLIRGDRPLRSHAVERQVPVPTQLANARRQIRAMAKRTQQRVENQKMKRTLERQRRIAEWQNWREQSVTLLTSHIQAQATILLLGDPPRRT